MLNDPIVVSLVSDGSRIFNEIIVGVKSYMEVSSETSDKQVLVILILMHNSNLEGKHNLV